MQVLDLEDALRAVEVGVRVVAVPHSFQRQGEDLRRQACAGHGVVLREPLEPEPGAHLGEHLARRDVEAQRVRAGRARIEQEKAIWRAAGTYTLRFDVTPGKVLAE